MPVFTALCGRLRLMFAPGTGGQVMQRLATPMVGGLFSATLLTLVVLPAAYVFVNRAWFGNEWSGEADTPYEGSVSTPVES